MVSRIKKIKNKDYLLLAMQKYQQKKVFRMVPLKLVEPDSNLKQDLYQIVALV
jgi:hypothetical protein